MPKPSLYNSSDIIQLIAGRMDNGISRKVNVIARLEFEPAYYDFGVQRINHYNTRISSIWVV